MYVWYNFSLFFFEELTGSFRFTKGAISFLMMAVMRRRKRARTI
jgi:hypothetical protein